MELPEQSMDESSVVGQGMTTTAVMFAVWQQGGQTFPLRVRKFITMSDGSSPRRMAPS
jgi:hypothetical protein